MKFGGVAGWSWAEGRDRRKKVHSKHIFLTIKILHAVLGSAYQGRLKPDHTCWPYDLASGFNPTDLFNSSVQFSRSVVSDSATP